MSDKDPYQELGLPFTASGGKPLSEQKSQGEKWNEEIEQNWKCLWECGCECDGEFSDLFAEHNCPQEGTNNCNKRKEKIRELMYYQEKQRLYLNRHPTGTFADDKQDTDWIDSLSEDMKKRIFGYNYNLKNKVTLLDKIKLLLKK